MNTRRILMAFTLFLALSLNIAVFGAQVRETSTPPPFNPKLGLSGIAGDQRCLYVMAAGKILQYELSSMKLLNSVDLPDLPLPAGGHPPMKDLHKKADAGECPPHHPHHGGPPQGLWTAGNYLYALAGPVLYRYSLPDLKLELTQELPKPEFPPPAGN